MKTKHTSGDWQLLRWGKEISGRDIDAAHIIQAHDGTLGVEVCRLPVCSETTEHGTRKKRKMSRAESLANGYLIEAAPDLLKTLERLSDYLELTHCGREDSMLAGMLINAKRAITACEKGGA